MHGSNDGIPTFIMVKKQLMDGYQPDFSGPGYYRMKKSMHDECVSDMSSAHDAEEPRLEADPKHKTTIKKLQKTADALHKASKLHGEQAETLEGLIVALGRSTED